jgi:hypothetical protein
MKAIRADPELRRSWCGCNETRFIFWDPYNLVCFVRRPDVTRQYYSKLYHLERCGIGHSDRIRCANSQLDFHRDRGIFLVVALPRWKFHDVFYVCLSQLNVWLQNSLANYRARFSPAESDHLEIRRSRDLSIARFVNHEK